jgi:hypothetical protein
LEAGRFLRNKETGMSEVNVVTYDDYAKFVTQLGSEHSMCDLNSKMGTGGLGLGGEAGEIAVICAKLFDCQIGWTKEVRDKLIDELGDILWYVAFTSVNVLGIRFTTVMPEQCTVCDVHEDWWRRESCHLKLIAACCSVSDIIKKLLYHGKPFEEDVKAKMVLALREVTQNVMFMASQICNTTLRFVITWNVQKLSERYKSLKFTTEEFMAKEAGKE